MKKRSVNTVKLGIFVLTGLGLLIFSLYLLGTNKNFFGNRFELKTRFRDVNGLLVGNNVRFSGIDVGNVRSITILNDTVIEVTLNIDRKMKSYIRVNALASIGTDGLIGNRVVNIDPPGGTANFVTGGETLPAREEVSAQEMLRTLYSTNENVARITDEIYATVHLVRTSSTLANLLNDASIPANLRASLAHVRASSEKASLLMDEAVGAIKLASEGKGTMATLLTDTTLAAELRTAVQEIQTLEARAGALADALDQTTRSVEQQLMTGKGTANAILRDSMMADRLRHTVENLEKGTASFAQDMEALKSNFLFRRYFKNQEKKAAKAAKKQQQPN